MTQTLTSRRLISWAQDAAERAAKTFAQAVIATATVTEGLAFDAYTQWDTWAVGFAAALVSVLTSIASKQTGSPNSASAL